MRYRIGVFMAVFLFFLASPFPVTGQDAGKGSPAKEMGKRSERNDGALQQDSGPNHAPRFPRFRRKNRSIKNTLFS